MTHLTAEQVFDSDWKKLNRDDDIILYRPGYSVQDANHTREALVDWGYVSKAADVDITAADHQPSFSVSVLWSNLTHEGKAAFKENLKQWLDLPAQDTELVGGRGR